MAIAWKALPVVERLDNVERRLQEISPLAAEARMQVTMARQGHNIPGYLDQKLSGIETELGDMVRRIRSRVGSARKVIPEAEVERERTAPPQVELQL